MKTTEAFKLLEIATRALMEKCDNLRAERDEARKLYNDLIFRLTAELADTHEETTMSLDCVTKNQEDVLAAVIGERAYQDGKWGPVSVRPREVGTYLTLMRKLLTDAEREYAESPVDTAALDEMRKVVAVGVACFEQHGVPSRMRKTR